MLKQIHLGGLLDECVLEIKEGKGHTESVDITNSIIVICDRLVAGKDINVTLGLGDISLLIKFLSTIDSTELSFKNKDTNFELKKPNGRRKLNYLLTNPELIATQLQADDEKKKDPYRKMKRMMEQKVELTESFIKDFLSYINLLKTKDATLEFDGEEELAFVCGGTNEHKLKLILSTEVESDEESDGFNIKVNGEYLADILSTVNFNEDSPPTLSFVKDKLIMVENDNAAWALVPLTDDSDEEG